MCTALSLKTKDHYFGRTLDLECSYGEKITVTPRRFPLKFRMTDGYDEHLAIIGVSAVVDGYPLYYDAVNENGLCMAGLNFPGNAFYGGKAEEAVNIAPFELIPYILGRCSNVREARNSLEKINIVSLNFSPELPTTPLHWMISDGEQSLIVEPMRDGIKVYDDPYGVLTNNPTFDKQVFALNNYRNLTPKEPSNTFSEKAELDKYSRGMGAIGLPGDVSSQSRYIRTVFTKLNSVSDDSEEESVSRFFHILGTVEQVKGCVVLENGELEKTVYTSCCNAEKGMYYYTTYENRAISSVDMRKEELDGKVLSIFSFDNKQKIYCHN